MPIYGVFFCVWCFDLSPTICPPALNSDAPPYYFAGLIGGQSVQAEGGLEPLPCRLTPPPDPPLLLLPASSGLPSPLPAPSAWRMWSVRSGVKGSSPGALAPGDSPRPSPSAWEGLAEGGGGNKEAFTGCLAGRGLFGLMRVVRCSLFHVHAPPEWNVDKVWDALPFICLFLVCRCERVSDFGGVFFFWWGLVGFGGVSIWTVDLQLRSRSWIQGWGTTWCWGCFLNLGLHLRPCFRLQIWIILRFFYKPLSAHNCYPSVTVQYHFADTSTCLSVLLLSVFILRCYKPEKNEWMGSELLHRSDTLIMYSSFPKKNSHACAHVRVCI